MFLRMSFTRLSVKSIFERYFKKNVGLISLIIQNYSLSFPDNNSVKSALIFYSN